MPPPRKNHPAKPLRLTGRERETAAIVAEQAWAAEGARRAEQMERVAKQAWEAERGAWCAARGIPRDGGIDRLRYLS